MITRLLIRYLFRLEDELVAFIGTKTQKGSLFAPIKTKELWKRETFTKKIFSIIKLKWNPSEHLVNEASQYIFKNDLFGNEDDYSEQLYKLTTWHNSREWDFSYLTELDIKKADSLDSLTILSRLRYEETSDSLHLNLFKRFPFMCILIHPMIVKIPVVSMQYFLTIHSHFAFNSIRKASHPQSDIIIDYLYEILYLQQKTAISLHEFLRLVVYSEKHKNKALLINAEITAIMSADLIFSYLKATVEKIISLIGLTFEITNLDSKPKHKVKLNALREGLPKKILDIYYVQFMFEFFSSENLDELNNYRSGLLHKRGIADLQPHNYVGEKADTVPLKKIFFVMQEQHSKNSAVLLGALAILTDKLVELDIPEIKMEDIPI
jgi:hypothetical protein